MYLFFFIDESSGEASFKHIKMCYLNIRGGNIYETKLFFKKIFSLFFYIDGTFLSQSTSRVAP